MCFQIHHESEHYKIQIAPPGTKFLRHLGSISARAPPDNQQENQLEKKREYENVTENLNCIVLTLKIY